MRLLPIYIFITLLFSSCGTNENKSAEIISATDSIIKDIPRFSDSNAAVLHFDDTSERGGHLFRSLQFKNVIPASLSIKEINELDSLTWEQIKKTKAKSFNLPYYKRQYVPVFNDKEEKIVWINYLCWFDDFEWKKFPFIAIDGGDCYFNLTINLKTKKCIAYCGGG